MRHRLNLIFFTVFTPIAAHAVLVRGHVTTPLGRPLPGSRVQLIALDGAPRNAASAIAGLEGEYELSANLSGRFLLITSPSVNATSFAPQIGNPFYGGRTDLLNVEIALESTAITPRLSGQSSLLETPLAQLSVPTVQIAADQLLTDATMLAELRPEPGVFIVQRGQFGSPAVLFLRGARVSRVLVDGVSAEDFGGGFDFGTLGSGGLGAIASTPAVEITPNANPLQNVDAAGGTLAISTAVATAMHPVLTYAGDGGNLSTTRNEVSLAAVHRRADALATFSRINAVNDLPYAPVHLIDFSGDVGYRISGGTGLRMTVRRDVSVGPIAEPFEFFGVARATRGAAQNLYAGLSFDTRSAGNWHNLVRYGLVRKRAEASNFSTLTSGLTSTITGANGYSTSGIATFAQLPEREDVVTDRDEVTWQTDHPVSHNVTAVLTARYQNERGADLTAARRLTLLRTHVSVASGFQGEIRHRFFFLASGLVDHSPTYGFTGAPSLGLTWVPILPGVRKFRGTSLHGTGATGVREPSVAETFATARPTPGRSRTFDVSIDQTLLPRKLNLRVSYFHNQFSHESEVLAVAPLSLSNALAYRTQGLESDLRFQPAPRLLLHGGYSYLAALVERSAATPVFNPRFPTIAIGGLTALTGGRPFQRPPQTGFVAFEYTGSVVTSSVRATFASRSDDSTGLTLNPTLLLPNRDLSPAYTSVDASVTYALTRHLTLYTQLSNLLNDRHLAPIGFVSSPFSVRAGVRIRVGRE